MQDNPMLKCMKKFTNQIMGRHLEINGLSFHLINDRTLWGGGMIHTANSMQWEKA